MKSFNTTAVCIPSENYMVDLSDRVEQIRKMIDEKKYFCINRGRQYGKTTTIAAMEVSLADEYDVISVDFQDVTDAVFKDEDSFSKGFAQLLCDIHDTLGAPIGNTYYDMLLSMAQSEKTVTLNDLFRIFDRWCKENTRPLILIIDEVDSATNNQVFLDFLGKLRSCYIKRQKNPSYRTFQSVILVGVTDVRHLKSKIRPEDEHKENSPWNVAALFDIDMSLSSEGIRGMLDEYEADHNTGMNTAAIAQLIRDYTNGYPVLVSRICQIIDQELVPKSFTTLTDAWTAYGVDEAVKLLLQEKNMLFDSIMGKLANYPALKGNLRSILMRGETLPWLPYDTEQQQLAMYGFIRNNHNTVAIANRIFEMLLYVHFVGESEKNEDLKQLSAASKSIFVTEDGWLDVRKIMEHFIVEHNRIHGDDSEKFLEAEGRERFLTYLSPIINGTGTYSIEEQTRTHRRMDVVIHYLGKRYVIELKIWHGERYNAEGEKQISDYMDYFHLDTGYMLSFNFNLKKETGVKRVQIGDKVLFEGTV